MIGKTFGIQAYQKALGTGRAIDGKVTQSLGKTTGKGSDFMNALKKSLGEVNAMEEQKNGLVEAFAAGKSENIHELMISLQKAGIAMSLTTAVRSKVLSAYQELMRISF